MTGQETPPTIPRWTAHDHETLMLDAGSGHPMFFTHAHRSEITESEWAALVAAVSDANRLRDVEAERDALRAVVARVLATGHDWGLGNAGREWYDLGPLGDVLRRDPVTDEERSVIDAARAALGETP